MVDFDVRRGNRGIPEDASILDRDLRDAEMVTKPVLSREPMKEPIEVGVA